MRVLKQECKLPNGFVIVESSACVEPEFENTSVRQGLGGKSNGY